MDKVCYNHIIEVTDDTQYRYRVEVSKNFTYITYEEQEHNGDNFVSFDETVIPTHLAVKVADAIKELAICVNSEQKNKFDPWLTVDGLDC